MPHAERLALATWIRQLWGMWCGANEGRYANDGSEVLRLERIELARRWDLRAPRASGSPCRPSSRLPEPRTPASGDHGTSDATRCCAAG